MHLERLEIQGFKTFAKKTVFTFPPPKGGRFPITAIVGSNGSGKSNSADALAWSLGEQSLKRLRGKQSEDVIFSRAGFAEVTVIFNNEDHAMPIDYGRVAITRRLYRDGTAEYLLNEGKVRLADIQLLLAQANVGQRSYSVIGQGMVDHILIASPEERKAFFDDATGVKPLQIKRHETLLKLKRTQENLKDAQMVLAEMEPRMRSLKRAAKRLEEREAVERELRDLERAYYGAQWWALADDRTAVETRRGQAGTQIETLRGEIAELEAKTRVVEEKETADDGLKELQAAYRALQAMRDTARRAQFETEKEIELTKIKAQSTWAPLPLGKIIEEIRAMGEGLKGLRDLKGLEEIRKGIEGLLARTGELSKRLERPNPEDIKADPVLLGKLKGLKTDEQRIEQDLKELEAKIDAHATQEHKARTELIEIQRALRGKHEQMHAFEQEQNRNEIERARLEERTQALVREMDEFMKEEGRKVREVKEVARVHAGTYADIQRLRYKLELIGGIDPETIQEYEETKQRFDFLESQISDLEKALADTQKIIRELDGQIEKQSKKIFGDINRKFQHYFKVLFGGGSCELVNVASPTPSAEETSAGPEEPPLDSTDASLGMTQTEGVDIHATPPGKRLKALNLLSGGERALTSIALLSAIMEVNPSPFVVLDEVDAALDEANTFRFAAILEELSQKSQFIIITHNRATMEKADVLYGVTMGDDGISSLLSVHMEEIAQQGTTRR